MKIGITGYHLLKGGGGIYFYLKNLITQMARIEPDNEYLVIFNCFRHRNLVIPDLGHKNISYSNINFPCGMLRWLWTNFNLPKVEKFVGPLDIVHGTHLLLPPSRSQHYVLTVHDIAYLKNPEYCFPSRDNDYGYRVLLPNALKRADKIIAISASTKKDLIEVFHLSDEKIEVVHYGIDEMFKPHIEHNTIERVLNKFGIKQKFVFYNIGTVQKRKNILLTLKAFRSFLSALKDNYLLILAGIGAMPEEIRGTICELELSNKIKMIQCERDEVAALLKAAAVVIYPTLYEGFGLPALEALACGAPLVASNVSSIPEIVGDASLLIDPTDEKAFGEAMARLVTDKKLRKELGQKGIDRAQKFSWAKAAQKTLDIYQSLL